MDHAYCEAICRGYKKGFLTDSEYIHLHSATNLSGMHIRDCIFVRNIQLTRSEYNSLKIQNHTHLFCLARLSDVKLNLQETDFGEFLRDQENLTPKSIKDAAIQKFTDEFQ